MQYRKDIDGLRAIAILPVIFYHAGLERLQGGFLGVDIFFVISGFLITSILVKELQRNSFSLINFYERRARRILPALFMVLLCTTLVAFITMPAPEFKEYAQSLLAVVTFLSNIFFYLEVDYFATSSELLPLLHTWSLSIEEQFYLFFPLILFGVWKSNKTYLLHVCIGIFCLSLAINFYLNFKELFDQSFYLLPARAWELIAGSIAAIMYTKTSAVERPMLVDASFATIILLCIFMPKQADHPGFYTVLIVFATCIVLLYQSPRSLCFKTLSLPFFTYIGAISYSLYIWHQPIFAFLRLQSIGAIPIYHIYLALILTFVLSALTYRFLETPFRDRTKFSKRFIFLFSSVGSFSFAIIALYIHFNDGIPSRFSMLPKVTGLEEFSPKRDQCRFIKNKPVLPAESCSYHGSRIEWAMLGDSHVIEPGYALAEYLKPYDIGVKHFSYGGCAPALSYESKSHESCLEWYKNTVGYISSDSEIKNVLFNLRYSSYISGDNIYHYPEISIQPSKPMKALGIKTIAEASIFFETKLLAMVNQLTSADKVVYIMTPTPELPSHINKLISGTNIFSDATLHDIEKTTTGDYYKKRHEMVLDIFDRLKSMDNVHVIDSYKLFCHSNYCPSVIDGKALYFDDDHLTVTGAKRIIYPYFEQLNLYSNEDPL